MLKNILKKMDFSFFSSGKYKTNIEKILEMQKKFILLDVRTNEEYDAIKIDFKNFLNIESLHIPLNELSERIDELNSDKNIVIFCPGNIRASFAYLFLLENGFERVQILDGGYLGLGNIIKPGKIKKYI